MCNLFIWHIGILHEQQSNSNTFCDINDQFNVTYDYTRRFNPHADHRDCGFLDTVETSSTDVCLVITDRSTLSK